MRVVVTGAGGLVGRAVAAHFASSGDEVAALDHRELDISNPADVKPRIADAKPDVVINCAAWTDVDGCESDPQRAEHTNSVGPQLLASNCREIDAVFITISTDYVFDGRKEGFYTQRDQPNPISVYGRSKLEGERRAQAVNARTVVVRSGYIFGPGGTNFLSTLVDRVHRGEHLRVISDMTGTPTYALDLAARLRELATLDLPGVYHVVNSGDGASFELFARTALEVAGLDARALEAVLLTELKRPAQRPVNSRLRCLVSEAIGLAPLPAWQAALAKFVSSQGPATVSAFRSA